MAVLLCLAALGVLQNIVSLKDTMSLKELLKLKGAPIEGVTSYVTRFLEDNNELSAYWVNESGVLLLADYSFWIKGINMGVKTRPPQTALKQANINPGIRPRTQPAATAS